MTSRVRYLVNVAPGISLSALSSSVMPKLGGDSEIPGAWDISTAVFSQDFSVTAQEPSPRDLTFKTNGTKMYVVGGSKTVYEYDLSTAWDVSTASYLQSLNINTNNPYPQDVVFKPDGTKMYVADWGGDNIVEYDLSTAWDVSTASYLQGFSIASEETSPRGVVFKPDGTKMYVIGDVGDDLNEYNLSVAWDVSTASYLQNKSVGSGSNPHGVFFKPDGTNMYVIKQSGDIVSEYELSAAWDISTASFSQDFNVGSEHATPTGVSFKSDGTKMYVIGSTNTSVSEYDLGT